MVKRDVHSRMLAAIRLYTPVKLLEGGFHALPERDGGKCSYKTSSSETKVSLERMAQTMESSHF